MPNVDDLFPRKHFTGVDVTKPTTLTIEKITSSREYVPYAHETQTVLKIWFQETDKFAFLSSAFAKSIAAALGEKDTDKWTGQQITIVRVSVKASGKNTYGLRAGGAT